MQSRIKKPVVADRIRCALAGTLATSAIVGGGSLALGAAPALAVEAPLTPCAAAHVIGARGSTEQPGFGSMGTLVKKIQGDVKATVSAKAVVYPAELFPYE